MNQPKFPVGETVSFADGRSYKVASAEFNPTALEWAYFDFLTLEGWSV